MLLEVYIFTKIPYNIYKDIKRNFKDFIFLIYMKYTLLKGGTDLTQKRWIEKEENLLVS